MLKITEIKPLFTSLVVTGNVFDSDKKENGIIVAKKGDLKLWQEVIAVGPMVRDIKVGDKVVFNPSAYVVRKYSKDSLQNDMDNNPIIRTEFNWVTVYDENDRPQRCLLLNDRDISYVYEGEEKWGNVIVPDTKIITLN